MNKKIIFIGLLFAIILAIFSFLASISPDGLEKVAEDKNFIDKANNFIKSPIPDYLFPGIKNEKIATILAGISGVLIMFVFGFYLAKLLNKPR